MPFISYPESLRRLRTQIKLAVVTSGIGRTLAIGLADAGAAVVAVGRCEAALAETIDAMNGVSRPIPPTG